MALVIVLKYILSEEVGKDLRVLPAPTRFAARAAPPDAIA
jgi:hypothetical protein